MAMPTVAMRWVPKLGVSGRDGCGADGTLRLLRTNPFSGENRWRMPLPSGWRRPSPVGQRPSEAKS